MTALPAGVGWRPEIAGFVAALPDLGFCEVVAETLHDHGRGVEVPGLLAALRDRGTVVVPHGVSLSLGGADPVDPARVDPSRGLRRGARVTVGERAHRVRPGRRARGRAPAAAAADVRGGRRHRGERAAGAGPTVRCRWPSSRSRPCSSGPAPN